MLVKNTAVSVRRPHSVYKKQRNRAAHCAQIAKSEYQERLAKLSRTQPKILYAYVQRNKRLKHSITALHDAASQTILDPSSQCELLSYTFGKILRQDNGRPAPSLPTSEFHIEPLVVTYEIVFSLLTNVDIHKKAGPDGLHPKILQTLAGYVTGPLSQTYWSWRRR